MVEIIGGGPLAWTQICEIDQGRHCPSVMKVRLNESVELRGSGERFASRPFQGREVCEQMNRVRP
jgi:hypothetical protein